MEVAICILAASQAATVLALAALVWKRLSVPDWRAATHIAKDNVDAYNAGLQAAQPRGQYLEGPRSRPAPFEAEPGESTEYVPPEDRPVTVARYGTGSPNGD